MFKKDDKNIHVGIYQQTAENSIYVSTYNFENEITKTFMIYEMNENEQFNFSIIFEDLNSEFYPNLGCCCLYLDGDYGNIEYMKECIEFGKAFGFEKIEILNLYGHQYLQAVVNANYKLKESESIWISEMEGTFIWDKIDGKAKLIFWSPFTPTSKTNFNKFQVAIDVHKAPRILFSHPDINVDYSLMKTVLPNTNVVICDRLPNLNIPLVKARLMANDSEVINYDFLNALNFEASVWYSEKEILSFNEFQKLPCQKFAKIVKQNEEEFLKIKRGKNTDLVSLPNYSRFLLSVAFDINQIYTFTFKELPYCTADTETELSYLNFLNKGNNKLLVPKISRKYEFLTKNILMDDLSINAIGIDFGSEFCYAAVNRRNGLEAIALDNTEERNLASYVSFDEENPKCGHIVKHRMKHFSKSSVYGLKHLVGKDYNNIDFDENWPFHVVPLEDNNFHIQLQKCGKAVSKYSEEIVAILFKTIKQKTEENKGRQCNEVAITYPYEFNERQINGIYTAASLAGWKSVHLLPEPFAAIFAYSLETPLPNLSTVVVIDVGSGSLKTTVLKIIEQEIIILSYYSTENISGKKIDTILENYFEKKLKTDYGISVDRTKKYKLAEECKRVKEDLSFLNEARINIDDFDFQHDDQFVINRTEFDYLISSLMFDMKFAIKETVLKSKADKIDKIFYFGGGSRIPAIKKLLEEIFQISQHCCHKQPTEVNSIGAAYYAYFLYLSTRKICDASLHNSAVFDTWSFILKSPFVIKQVLKNYKF